MKTTDQTSARITVPSPAPRWSRVRPALRWTLGASVAAWLGVVGAGALPSLESGEFLESAAQFFTQNASPVVNVLAFVSVVAVCVERARTTGGLRKVRRRLARSVRTLRLTQRLVPGSRTARA